MSTFSADVSGTQNDGTEIVGTGLFTNFAPAGFVAVEDNSFFRFLAVTVPSGATIVSATLTFNIVDLNAPNTTLYGVDEDNVAEFADPGNLPSAAARTTASADPDPSGLGLKVVTITAIVQEIVDRAGWASGNAMAFVVDDNAGAGFVYWEAEDLDAAGSAPAQLDIEYTEPTAPTIAAGPVVGYNGLTRTGPNNTPWTLAFTATDPEETGADALTWEVWTGAARTGTMVASGTCTSGVSRQGTIAYNASGLVDGSQTLYLSVDDGTLTSTDSSFTLKRDDVSPTAATAIVVTP